MRAITVRAALVVSLTTSSYPAEAAKCEKPVVKFECQGPGCDLTVKFPNATPELPPCRIRVDDDFVKAQKASRITDDTVLRVTVEDVNFLRYDLKFEVTEKVVESYVFLERLWKQVFGLFQIRSTAVDRTAMATDDFGWNLVRWFEGLEKADEALSDFLQPFSSITLTGEQKTAIATQATLFGAEVDRLEEFREATKDAIGSSDKAIERLRAYKEMLRAHTEVVDRFNAFAEAAGLVTNGYTKRVPFGDAGRIVTVTITPVASASSKEYNRALTLEFLVHTTLPLTFHVGYTMSTVERIDFETVAGAARSDLFAKIESEGLDQDVTAFMSWTPRNAWFHVALGTAFSQPGEKIFVGTGYRWRRYVLTVGAVNAGTREEDGVKVTETIIGTAGTLINRDLFTSFKNRRDWEYFGAISFAPF